MATPQNLMLVAMVLGLAGAGPVPTPKPATLRRGCHIDRFKSLPLWELDTFRRANDALEESLLLKKWSCNSQIFFSTWDLRELPVWERPVALEAELVLTLRVLGNVDNSALGPVLDQPLHTLHHIHSELRACVPAQPTANPKTRGRHPVQQAMRKDARRCLEASVTFNLFRLLIQDLKCVAGGDQCV